MTAAEHGDKALIEAMARALGDCGHWSGELAAEHMARDLLAALRPHLAAERAARDAEVWRPIETAPTDGTLILVYAPTAHGLDAIICPCAWHPDAGFCVDELRSPTHWMPLPPPPGDAP